MDGNNHEVQWWRATSQVNEEVSRHMYFAGILRRIGRKRHVTLLFSTINI